MDRPEISNDEFTLPKQPNTNLRFIKNEEGKRVAQQLQDADVEVLKEKKEIGIIVVGHIGHTQTAIIEALNRSDYQGKTILVVGSEPMMMQGPRGPMLQEEHLKELEKTPIIINSLREDFSELFLEKKERSYTNFNKHYIPKIQQSKASRKKYTQRKK